MAGIATGLRVQLQIGVNPSDAGDFNVVEVHRSVLGPGGPYTEITGPTWSPPSIKVPATALPLVGTSLLLRLDESTDITVSFSGVNPLSASAQATQIQTQGAGLLQSFVDGPDLVIRGVAPGGSSTLRVLPSDAASLLGLPQEEPGSVFFGVDQRPAISASSFTDPHGSTAYFYKIRLRSSTQNTVSDFSAPFRITVGGLPGDRLVSCYAELYDVSGRPRSHATILLETVAGLTNEGQLIVGRDLQLTTDATGRATVNLVRGTTIRVTVPDANLHRRFVVPVDPSVASVNLLSVQEGEDDAFTVQQPQLEFATRRST